MQKQNCIYIKFEMKHQIDGYTSLHKRQNNGYDSVEPTIAQALIRRLQGLKVESTVVVQGSNQRLYKRRIDDCTSVALTVTIVESTVILIN